MDKGWQRINGTKNMRRTGLIIACLRCILSLLGPVCFVCATPICAGATGVRNYSSTAGLTFQIHPEYSGEISHLINTVRSDLSQEKANGKFLAYLSVPISGRWGGCEEINKEIASNAVLSITKRFGPTNLFVLNPAERTLLKIGEVKPGRGEYMAVWADVLAGTNGEGNVFDMIYFVGPSDALSYFGTTDEKSLAGLNRWFDEHAAKFQLSATNRSDFLRYYGFLASSTYSQGARDEWNIAMQINRKRKSGPPVAIYFDGRAISPAELNAALRSKGH